VHVQVGEGVVGTSAKKTKKLEKAERKLERARANFEAMREQYLLVREQGKQQVERAQLEADRRLTKVKERLEKRGHALNLAEERILAFGPEEASLSASGSTSNERFGTPEDAANALEHVQEQRGQANGLPILHGQ
jgi:chromosome segregation ATPase